MDIDWTWLGWFVPLTTGAGLTFFFGWLDSTLKYRRDQRERSQAEARELAERQRVEARDHAAAALALASRIRDSVDPGPTPVGQVFDPQRDQAAKWDRDEINALQDLGVLIPDPLVRSLIKDASNLVTASGTASEANDYEESARAIQTGAMRHLREVLGAYLRIEALPPDDVEWIAKRSDQLSQAWDELERLAREHYAARDDG
ncbi:hypothetical protein AB0O14_05910 [Microbacterium foliorum]